MDRGEFPYPYGSDLHWLWGWGSRLKELLVKQANHGGGPSRYDWMAFRPDDLARDAMLRFSMPYPMLIQQIEQYLDDANDAFAAFLPLLPPLGCPQCGRDDDFEDVNGWRHCWSCGERSLLPSQEGREQIEYRIHDTFQNLSRVVLVAADAIAKTKAPTADQDGESPAPSEAIAKKQKSKWWHDSEPQFKDTWHRVPVTAKTLGELALSVCWNQDSPRPRDLQARNENGKIWVWKDAAGMCCCLLKTERDYNLVVNPDLRPTKAKKSQEKPN